LKGWQEPVALEESPLPTPPRASALNKQYAVTLTAQEREQLEQMVSKGKAAARSLARAWVLLKADARPTGPSWTDAQIPQTFSVGMVTI
jgi:hypothetical protein